MSTHQSEATYLVRLRCQSAANGVPYLETLEEALKKILSENSSAPICTEPDNLFVLKLDVVACDWFECEICGDNHSDSLHGEALFSLDHGRDTVENLLGDQIAGLDNLVTVQDEILDEVQASYNFDVLQKKDSGDPLEIDFSWYDMKMRDVAEQYGYVIYNSADAGTWSIYKAVNSLL